MMKKINNLTNKFEDKAVKFGVSVLLFRVTSGTRQADSNIMSVKGSCQKLQRVPCKSIKHHFQVRTENVFLLFRVAISH